MLLVGKVVNKKQMVEKPASLYHIGFMEFQTSDYKTIGNCFPCRLCIRSPFWHLLPVLRHCTHVRRLRTEDDLAGCESRFPVVDVL